MQLFEAVISQFQSNSQYEKFIKESEKEYDIKIYRMGAFTITYARAIYSELNDKYADKILTHLPQGWYENERRLYVWFIICFMQLKLIDPLKFVDAYEKYWKNISQTFWQKEVFFLKYQLLNIIKTKGRTLWKADEDQILWLAYKKHQVGEWNEVAKTFYKLSEEKYFKTPKQCRERWQNHLNKDIKKGEWSTQEDLIIFQFVESMGTKWAKIVPLLNHSRTEHMIKNRYKSLTSKAVQEKNISQSEATSLIRQQLKAKLLEERENPAPKEQVRGPHDELVIEKVQSQEIQFDERAIECASKQKHKQIQREKHGSMRNSNSSRLKQGFELSRSAKEANHEFKVDCSRIDEFLGKNLVDESLCKSSNSFFSKMILFSSNNNFPNNSINIGFPEDRSFFGNSSMKEVEERHNHIFFESQSFRSKKSKNNESIIGKYISEI